MSQVSLQCAVGEWEIQLPTKGRRWVTFAGVTSVGVLCGLTLRDVSVAAPIALLTFFLAAVSGVSGLWSP